MSALKISSRFGSAFKLHEKRPAEAISTGVSQIDEFTGGGLPRGSITEAFGAASSGRTSLMLSALAHATTHDEVCALVDTNNSFDPKSATQAEINCERLLWIRCHNNIEHAFKATDLLLQGGGFGVVMLDLGDVPAKSAKRIISSWWYRFRRTLESTPTALLVIAEESCVRSCAALALELRGETWAWSSAQNEIEKTKPQAVGAFSNTKPARHSGRPFPSVLNLPGPLHRLKKETHPSHSNLLQGLHLQVQCHRPLHLQKRANEIVFTVAR